jgi:4-alpha-glucanotransferase
VLAGVPPDYFSATGQRWGNPLYRWPRIKKTGYAWWIARLGAALARFDVVRLDHFIGFVRCWEIPASEPTAINGTWRPVPGRELFERAKKKLGGELPLIAEDLGLVTPAVRRLRRDLGLPGIRLLQFAFGTDPQAHLFVPHNYVRNAVAYTGTHDNDTTCGWFYEKGGEGSTRTPEQTQKERANALEYLGEAGDLEIHWAMIRTVYASVARLAIIPMQDFLGLGSEARMNKPGTLEGKWAWRLDEADLTAELAERVRKLAVTYGRRKLHRIETGPNGIRL